MLRKFNQYCLILFTILSLITGCASNDDALKKESSSEPVVQQQEQQSSSNKQQSNVETQQISQQEAKKYTEQDITISADDIPDYSGDLYIPINGNVPYFSKDELTTATFEYYSDLDSLGRCGSAYANLSKDTMPTSERESISKVKPSGWNNKKYDNVDGGWLYNRSHLIGFQLAGENANEENLITGTRYFNVEGMLPFENMVADYIKETDNHVLYRVTPIYHDNDLVAKGVLIEAKSVEDDHIEFCVFVYNVQPDIEIDYATGESRKISQDEVATYHEDTHTESIEDEHNHTSQQSTIATTYVLNTNTKKFHLSDCASVSRMSEKNKLIYEGNRQDVINQGYDPCKKCNP